MCARFLSYLLLLYIGRVHGPISGCTVLGEVHPVSGQNKSLISDTVCVFIYIGKMREIPKQEFTKNSILTFEQLRNKGTIPALILSYES